MQTNDTVILNDAEKNYEVRYSENTGRYFGRVPSVVTMPDI